MSTVTQPVVPEWLHVGAKVAIATFDSRAPRLTEVTVTKVGKRDVVLSDGTRFNVHRRIMNSGGPSGSWGPSMHLVPLTDERLPALRARRHHDRLSGHAEATYTKWRRDQTPANAAAVAEAFTRLAEVPE